MSINLDEFPVREAARDMLGMVSPIYDQSYVGKWMFEIMGLPIGEAQQYVRELKDQLCPETATWSLGYWEQSYGLPTIPGLSIEERRWRIIRRRNYRKPMNPARMELLLEELCGRDVTIRENVAPHTFGVEIAPGDSEVDIDRLEELLDEIKQSQKSYHFVFEVEIGIQIRTGAVRQEFGYRLPGNGRKAGRWPRPANESAVRRGTVNVHPVRSHLGFPYTPAGTRPDVSTPGTAGRAAVEIRPLEHQEEIPFTTAGTRPDVNVPGRKEGTSVDIRPGMEAMETASPPASESRKTGRYPDVSIPSSIGRVDVDIEADGRSAEFAHRTASKDGKAGTYPDIAMEADVAQTGIDVIASMKAGSYPYPLTREDSMAGTHPDTATAVAVSRAAVNTHPSEEWSEAAYPAAGTRPDTMTTGAQRGMAVDAHPDSRWEEIQYHASRENSKAGTAPSRSMEGGKEPPGVNAHIAGKSVGIVHRICGAKKL